MIVPLSPLRCMHRAVDLYGNKIGIVSGDLRFTYAEFGRRCERLATALAAEGIQPGDRVAYLSFNNHQLLEGYFGVIQAGAIAGSCRALERTPAAVCSRFARTRQL